MGEYAKAEPFARQAIAVRLDFFTRTVVYLPEARAMTLLSEGDEMPRYDKLLSVLRKLPNASHADAYGAVWETRGIVSRTLAERRLAWTRSPQADPLVARLRDTSQQLAQLTLSTPKTEQRQARARRLAELNEEKEGLESHLAKVSTEFRRSQEVRQAKIADLAAVLPEGMAAVDLVRCSVWEDRREASVALRGIRAPRITDCPRLHSRLGTLGRSGSDRQGRPAMAAGDRAHRFVAIGDARNGASPTDLEQDRASSEWLLDSDPGSR